MTRNQCARSAPPGAVSPGTARLAGWRWGTGGDRLPARTRRRRTGPCGGSSILTWMRNILSQLRRMLCESASAVISAYAPVVQRQNSGLLIRMSSVRSRVGVRNEQERQKNRRQDQAQGKTGEDLISPERALARLPPQYQKRNLEDVMQTKPDLLPR